MVTRKGRQISGGKYLKNRKKKKCELPGQRRVIKLGEDKRKTMTVRGGNKKTVLLRAQTINVLNKDKKTKKVIVKNVLETPSNRFLARQNIITKGTIVQTELGKVKVTNRPTQEGTMNGILIIE
jgi:small subunit ribosomal protein S8e